MRAKKKSRKYRKKSRNLSEGPIYLSRHSFLSRASLAVLERPSTTWLTSNKKTRQPPWENTSRFVRIDREETETSSCYQLRKQTCACVRRHAAKVDLNYSGNFFQCPEEQKPSACSRWSPCGLLVLHLRFRRAKQFIRERLRDVELHLIPRETVCFSGESISISVREAYVRTSEIRSVERLTERNAVLVEILFDEFVV